MTIYKLKKLLHHVFPTACLICRSRLTSDPALCGRCLATLPQIDYSCLRCGEALYYNQPACGACLKDLPAFTRTISLFPYEPPVKQFIIGLKFSSKLHYAKLLGQLLAKHVASLDSSFLPESIIPVPLHRQRLIERGFNQSLEIAKVAGRQLQISVDRSHCRRVKNTVAQSSLPAKDRVKNIKNAFVVSDDIPYDHVAIIDDVMTTTHTVRELSLALNKAGVRRIDVWVVARAGGKKYRAFST